MCAGTDGLDSFDADELESEWQQLVVEETKAQQQQQQQEEKKKENRTEALTQRTLTEQANAQTQMVSQQPAAEHQTARWPAAANHDHDHDIEQLAALMSSASMNTTSMNMNMNNNNSISVVPSSSSLSSAAPVVAAWPSVEDLPDPSELSFPDVPTVEPRLQLSETSTNDNNNNNNNNDNNHDKLPLYA